MPRREPDAAVRQGEHRKRVLIWGGLGLGVGLALGALWSGTDGLTRWVLMPLAAASLGSVVGFLAAARSLVQPRKAGSGSLTQSRSSATSEPAMGNLVLGPSPWKSVERINPPTPAVPEPSEPELLVPDSAVLPVRVNEPQHPRQLSFTPVPLTAPVPASMLNGGPSIDPIRLASPDEHELEGARRAVANLAPGPGAFDAVCERLLEAGEVMADDLKGLERSTTDHEKYLGADLYARLAATRITEVGLDLITWVRWVNGALLDGIGTRDEFFAPLAVALASRYGAVVPQWHAAISESPTSVEVPSLALQIALRVKTQHRRHYSPPDRAAVGSILEAPQWI